MLRKKAAEELKKEQERKAEERKRMIIQRTGKPKPLEDKNEAALQALCREYHKRIVSLGQCYMHHINLKLKIILVDLSSISKTESEKYDLEWDVRCRDVEVRELLEKVNNFRGKL